MAASKGEVKPEAAIEKGIKALQDAGLTADGPAGEAVREAFKSLNPDSVTPEGRLDPAQAARTVQDVIDKIGAEQSSEPKKPYKPETKAEQTTMDFLDSMYKDPYASSLHKFDQDTWKAMSEGLAQGLGQQLKKEGIDPNQDFVDIVLGHKDPAGLIGKAALGAVMNDPKGAAQGFAENFGQVYDFMKEEQSIAKEQWASAQKAYENDLKNSVDGILIDPPGGFRELEKPEMDKTQQFWTKMPDLGNLQAGYNLLKPLFSP